MKDPKLTSPITHSTKKVSRSDTPAQPTPMKHNTAKISGGRNKPGEVGGLLKFTKEKVQ